MITAFLREMELRKEFFPEEGPLKTIYFGGGTPSVCSPAQLALVIDKAAQLWGIEHDAEITLEANPDDLSLAYLESLIPVGINRLSIGVQSFVEEDLLAMNRSHSAAQAHAALTDARRAGFENFTLDLIFGLPGRSVEDWEKNLEIALDIRPPHLSVYSLTIEEKTALAYQVKTRKVFLPTDESFEAQFLMAHERLTAAGYEHYELSNYALPGHRARHNGAYWAGRPYLGIGPSAHSFDGSTRSWNYANNHRYLSALETAASGREDGELLSPRDHYHEYVMMGLRTEKGIDAEEIRRRWFPDWSDTFASELTFWIRRGVLQQSGSIYRLNPTGWFLSDRIASDFFIEMEEE